MDPAVGHSWAEFRVKGDKEPVTKANTLGGLPNWRERKTLSWFKTDQKVMPQGEGGKAPTGNYRTLRFEIPRAIKNQSDRPSKTACSRKRTSIKKIERGLGSNISPTREGRHSRRQKILQGKKKGD